MKYRFDRERGIVDKDGYQVVQLVANFCTDAFRDQAGKLLAKALSKVAGKEKEPKKGCECGCDTSSSTRRAGSKLFRRRKRS